MTDREFQPDSELPSDYKPGYTPPSDLPAKIFNTQKTDYERTPLFFGQEGGLLDTINKQYPKLWSLYKTLRSLDWDENEFDYSSCNVEFATSDPTGRICADFMIKTLAWQWEADSMASRAIATIMGPVCSSTELWCGYVKINENENVHGLTYSEIVRSSFDNPDEVLKEILEVKEAMSRLTSVAQVMGRAHEVSHKYALGQVEADQESYNAIFMFLVAMYFLERVQFMSSFAITFAVCRTGLFQPIGKAVERIAQDEFEIHAQFGQEVLRIELATERGRIAYQQCKPMIVNLLDEILNSEDTWLEYLFSSGNELPGFTLSHGKRWNKFNGRAAAVFIGVEQDLIARGHEFPQTNPLPFMLDYLDVSASQSAPQEEQNAQYKVNLLSRDDDNEDFELVL
jgi:ribonucleoside-diphosphate reductase beta chain